MAVKETIRRVSPFPKLPDVDALEKEIRERLDRMERAIQTVLEEVRKLKTGAAE